MAVLDGSQAPRFRVVFELRLRDADPYDPSDYQGLLDRLTKLIANNEEIRCEDVIIRSAQRIGEQDDYDDWKLGRGEYDPKRIEERLAAFRATTDRT